VIPGGAVRSQRQRLDIETVDSHRGPQPELDDHVLVRRFQQDPNSQEGRAAVTMLLTRYRQRVLAWCWRVVKDRDVALDLAQDVLLSAYRNLDRFQESSQFSAWLFSIARNRCLDELRRRKVAMAEEAVLELVADPGPRPDLVLERKQLGENLDRLVLTHLDDVEQEALWLRCYEGLSVDVITQRLGLQEASGARAVLQRARRKLRSALAMSETGLDGPRLDEGGRR